MANDNLDLQAEVAALRLENEALRREQERLLAERKEAFDLVLEKIRTNVPDEAEMVSQLAKTVPFSEVMKVVNRILHGQA